MKGNLAERCHEKFSRMNPDYKVILSNAPTWRGPGNLIVYFSSVVQNIYKLVATTSRAALPKGAHTFLRCPIFIPSPLDMMMPLIPVVHSQMPDEEKQAFYNDLYDDLRKRFSRGSSTYTLYIDICVVQGSKASMCF